MAAFSITTTAINKLDEARVRAEQVGQQGPAAAAQERVAALADVVDVFGGHPAPRLGPRRRRLPG